VFVIGRVACIDRRGAVTPQQRFKGFIDERDEWGDLASFRRIAAAS
jgi:hypothetical protein